jgi:multidrug resistance efflux pump
VPKTASSIATLQQANQAILQVFINTAQVASVAIANSIVDTRYYPQSQLNSDQSTVSSMNSKALSLLATITNAIKNSQSNNTSRLTLQNNLDSAKRTLNELKSSYALQIQQKQNDIDTNNQSINLNNEKLINLQDGPTQLDRATSQNQIQQAQINLSKSVQRLDDYKLIAQFDGVVTTVNIKV